MFSSQREIHVHQQTDSSGIAVGRVVENLKEGTGRGSNDIVDVSWYEKQNDEENCAGECTDTDAVDHDLRTDD